VRNLRIRLVELRIRYRTFQNRGRDTWSSQREDFKDCGHALPVDSSIVSATQPLVPNLLHSLVKPLERRKVPGHAIVGVVPSQLSTQHGLLLFHWTMVIGLTPNTNASQRTTKTILRRFLFHAPSVLIEKAPMKR
jgi:hypothetical protein